MIVLATTGAAARELPTTPDACILLWENFDGMTTWSFGGGWVLSNAMPDSPPNCAFVDDPPFIADRALDSPPVSITSISAQLRFRNNYNTDYNPPPDEMFWDGGVLEISSPNINGGAFTDVTDPAVGASFVSGGYTGEISLFFDNPLAGRLAWSGNSGGYIDTILNLGPNVNGQTIRFRWRFGSDFAAGGVGWRIDNVVVTRPGCAPVVMSAVSRKTHGNAGNFDIALPLTGAVGIECRRGGGANFGSHQVVVAFTNPVTLSGVAVASPDGGSATTAYSASSNQVTVNLSNATDQHTLFLTLANVNDGGSTGDVTIPLALLRGDTNADRLVNSGDSTQTRSRSGQTTNTTNFRSDANADGIVNSGDVTIVRNASGDFLP